MMKVFDCLVAGETNVDLLLDTKSELEFGKEKLAERMSLVLGGSSSITAFNLARLGASVRFVSVVGTDSFGRFIEERLEAAGVDLSAMRRSKKAATGLTMWLSRRGRRAGLTYAGTISMLRESDIRAEHLRLARHLHVGHYFLLKNFHGGAPAVFARARRMGLSTSLDCNYDPAEQWESGIWDVLRYTDVFLPNEEEALRLTGSGDCEKAAEKLAQFAGTVVVKLGRRGALAMARGQTFRVPAKRVRVVDTTGAGDSFNAGFLSRFLRGASLRECVEAGISSAAKCVQQAGGTAAFEARR
ncbi:MAG: sugar kinase [Acidobacteriaceae bacterium]|nr:sugar kinase [Acidobacteriaceae bacterium]